MTRSRPFRSAAIAVLPLVLALALFGARAAEEPTAEEIFRGWFERTYEFDALEVYAATGPDGLSMEFLLARRWVENGAEIAIDVRHPPALRHNAYLFRVYPDKPDHLAYLTNPHRPRTTWRIGQLPVQQLDANVFRTPVNLTPLEIRPLLPEEFEHERLPDETVAGERCRVVSSRLKKPLGIDRVELAISVESGIALRTRYFRGEGEVRRALVDPGDVKAFGDRLVPAVRRIESPNGRPLFELRLVNAQFDAVVPAGVFSLGNLKAQRYPSL